MSEINKLSSSLVSEFLLNMRHESFSASQA